MPTDIKALSPEVEAARLATAAQKQLAKEKSQADLDAQNKAMKARLADKGGGDSKGLSAETEAARKAAAEASARMKAEEQARINESNRERRKSRETILGADAKELDPEVEAARLAAAAEKTIAGKNCSCTTIADVRHL